MFRNQWLEVSSDNRMLALVIGKWHFSLCLVVKTTPIGLVAKHLIGIRPSLGSRFIALGFGVAQRGRILHVDPLKKTYSAEYLCEGPALLHIASIIDGP